jgi:hypothetical protein
MEPIFIKTGEKLTKFWSKTRLILTGIVLSLWIITFHFSFHFTVLQQVCGLVIFAAVTCLAQAIHHKQLVTLEYSLNIMGLYCYQTSFNNKLLVRSKRICKLQEIKQICVKENTRCIFIHHLILKTRKKVIKIKVFGRIQTIQQLCDHITEMKKRYESSDIEKMHTSIANSASSLRT